MKKSCVFCGKPPDKKTKEHVIPRWLIEMTGDPKRVVQFGTVYSLLEKNPHRMSADQLVFPACHECNDLYSNLERRVKKVFESLLSDQAIDAQSCRELLDWFDKVRVGLWLGIRYLDGDPYGIEPRFHISERVGAADRTLLVYRMDDDFNSLAVSGTGSAVFPRMPSCLGIRVHHLYFVTISSAAVNARRLGFPFVASIERSASSVCVNLRSGLERTLLPVLRGGFPIGYHALHQPTMVKAEGTPFMEFYKSDYVTSRTDQEGAFEIAHEYPGSLRWDGEFVGPESASFGRESIDAWRRLNQAVYEYQLKLWEDPIAVGLVSPGESRHEKAIMGFVKSLQRRQIGNIRTQVP